MIGQVQGLKPGQTVDVFFPCGLSLDEGVSRATTRTVVHSSLAILGLDFILTAIMF